jgi:hypothetical protein
MSLPLLSVNFVSFIGAVASATAGTSGFGTTAITQLHIVLVVPWD